MARDIFINTESGSLEQSVVVGVNRPNQRVPLREIVAGSSETYNLYLVDPSGGYDARSGLAGTDVEVSIAPRGATAKSGTFTVSDGTDTSDPISANASANVVEAILNAMNSGAGYDSAKCDVTKLGSGQWLVVFRTVGNQATGSGLSVDLTPESVVNISTSIDGTATVREQIIIEVNRQPAIYQDTWSLITDGYSGTISANTGRVAQALDDELSLSAYFEVRIDDGVVCSQPIKIIAPVGGTGSVYGTATIPQVWAANPTAVDGFDADAWAAAISFFGFGDLTPTDGLFAVGDGSDWVGESGDTAKTSLGILSLSGGGQLGSAASASTGGSVGSAASASSGGAVGQSSSATTGFAGGKSAVAIADKGVQLSDGINPVASTIQFLNSGSITAAQFGRLNTSTTTVTSTAYTALTTDSTILVDDDTAGAAVTVTLLSATTAGDGFEVSIKKLGTTAAVTIATTGAETIDGAATLVIEQSGEVETIISDGTNWQLKSEFTKPTYGSIYVGGGSTSQTIAAGAGYTKSTAFTTNGNASPSSVADATNDKLVLTRGVWQVSGSFSFSAGSNNINVIGAAFLDGAEMSNIHFQRKIGTGIDVGSAGFTGFVIVDQESEDLDVRFREGGEASYDITIVYGNLSANKIG